MKYHTVAQPREITVREKLVLRTIRRFGSISRARLIRETGLSGVAIFRATTDLAAEGLIEIGAVESEGRGQPSNIVRIRSGTLAALGIAIMHDHVEAVLVDMSGELLRVHGFRCPGMIQAAIVAEVKGFVAGAMLDLGLDRHALIGGSLAIAGFFVETPNAINPAPGLDDWALVDLKEIMERALGIAFAVENVANAGAIGERLLGVGQTIDSFAYLNFGHGFGAGLIIGGELMRGRSGNAGEIVGVLDMAGLPSPNLKGLRADLDAEGLRFADFPELARRFDPGWPGVRDWVDAHGPSLSFLANVLWDLLDVEAIVLGGLIPSALATALIERVIWRDDITPPRRGVGWPRPRMMLGKVREHAAAIGGACSVLSARYFI